MLNRNPSFPCSTATHHSQTQPQLFFHPSSHYGGACCPAKQLLPFIAPPLILLPLQSSCISLYCPWSPRSCWTICGIWLVSAIISYFLSLTDLGHHRHPFHECFIIDCGVFVRVVIGRFFVAKAVPSSLVSHCWRQPYNAEDLCHFIFCDFSKTNWIYFWN